MDEREQSIEELKRELLELQQAHHELKKLCEESKRDFIKAESALNNSEEKYRTIFENVQDVFYRTDLNGILHEISPSIKYLSSFHAEDLLGKSVNQLYADPNQRLVFIDALRKNGEVRDFEIKVRTRQGDIKYGSVNARLILSDVGTPHHIDGAIRDISERKYAEEAVRQSEKELNHAQEIAGMGSWQLDLRTGKSTWSENMYTMLGYAGNMFEISYEKFLEIVHPDDRPLIDRKMKKLISTQTGVRFDFRHLLSNGEIKWFRNSVEPHLLDGQVISLTGVNIDITESKLLESELIRAKEKAEASDRLKTAFLNNISHEIRTPLNAIQGFATLIIDPSLDYKEKLELVEIVNTSTQRLIQTITDFMDVSLISSGNVEVVKKEFSIGSMVNEVVQQFKHRCNEKSLILTFDIPDQVLFQLIESDQELLLKILSHLFFNAIKFTKEGSITLGISNKGCNFEFFVKDTGVGIKQEFLPAIFNNFVQEDDSNARAYEGSGLGLSIVRSLVNLLGGNIRVESEKNKGSTFFFTIPCDSLPVPVPVKNLNMTNTILSELPLLLIAEDDDMSFRLLERILRSTYQIIRAVNGLEVVELCKSTPGIQLILMDIKMPALNGYEATQQIRQFNKEVVIIAQTSNGLSRDRDKALESGCNEYITKPINIKELEGLFQKYFVR